MTNEKQEPDLFLKCLLEANVDGIIAFDHEFRYTLWNRAMEKFSGVNREKVLGNSAFELFPGLKETGEDKYYSDALAGKTIVAETRPYNIPETGRSGFFDGYYSPRHDENGVVVGGVAIIRDVTDRKRAEATAIEAHRLAFHVENTPLAVIEWDHEFRVLRWSPAAERLFGWVASEVMGKRFSDWSFVVHDDVDAVNEVGNRQNQGQEHHGISRNRNYTKLGSVVNFEWYNSALYDQKGKLIAVLSLVLDVTLATRIEDALRKSEAQYRLLFESNPHAMWVYDQETLRFLSVNTAALEQYGYSNREFLDLTLKDIHFADGIERLVAHVAQQVGAEQPRHLHVEEDEVRAQRVDGGGGRRPARRLADALDPVVLGEHLAQPQPRDRLVVGDQRADLHARSCGTRKVAVKPAPGALRRSRLAPLP